MMETVIKSSRPQMVGNYYRPYHISYEDVYAELEDNKSIVAHSAKMSHFLDNIIYIDAPHKNIQYDPIWETVRWGSDMRIERAYKDYIPDEALDSYYGGSDPDYEDEDGIYIDDTYNEDFDREHRREMEWLRKQGL